VSLFEYDESLRSHTCRHIAGLDEAGRGPLAGPVVAAAVIFPPKVTVDSIRDSKQLSSKQRQQLFGEILVSSYDIGVGIVSHELIDRLNILKATMLAMRQAIYDLSVRPDILILDAIELPDIKIKQQIFCKAETISASVAAASIVAKHIRDSIMLHYDSIYPQYNFRKHKGYPTAEHRMHLNTHGPCPIHRKTFRNVKELIHSTKF